MSKGSADPLEQNNTSSDGTNECRSGKDFFELMRGYMEAVDQVLRQSTCTYHHIVKNSIKKQVEAH